MLKTSNLEEQEKQGLIYCIRLLTMTKRSESNIRQKLKEKGYDEKVAERIATGLKAKKLLNDLEFAKAKVYWARHGNLIGKKRIAFDLRKKGLKTSVISEALQDYDPASEKTSALELAKNRYDKLKSLDPLKRKKRIYDFLARRGFDYEICREVISEIEGTR